MSRIKLVAFDLDGTIGDTIPLCIEAFKKAVQPYVGYELSDNEVTRTFGVNEEGMIRRILGTPCKDFALKDFYAIYGHLHKLICPQPFPGIRELITALKQRGILVALVTGKGMKSCEITLRQFKMNTLFDKVLTGDAERNIKSDALKQLLKDYGLSADEAVYIGDTVSDIIECEKINVVCLSAAWGISSSAALESNNPKNVFYSISSLSDFLKERAKNGFTPRPA